MYRGALDKVCRLQTLARQRRSYRHPFQAPEDFPDRNVRFDFAGLVSPYSRSAGNADAKLMVILQVGPRQMRSMRCRKMSSMTSSSKAMIPDEPISCSSAC
jgi:hypothetical protein